MFNWMSNEVTNCIQLGKFAISHFVPVQVTCVNISVIFFCHEQNKSAELFLIDKRTKDIFMPVTGIE